MRNQRGITLIALVITIIVLLILAGVTIAMLSGDNSILNRATEASYTNDIAEGKDQVSVAWNAAYTTYLAKYYTDPEHKESFESLLVTELGNVNNSGKYTITIPTAAAITAGDGLESDTGRAKIRVTSKSDKNKYSEAAIKIDLDTNAVTQATLGDWSAIN